MIKTEQKRIATKKRMDFHAKTYETAMRCILETSASIRSKKVEIHITQTNYNHYIRCQVYGANLTVLIYTDGNVSLKFKELSHNEYVEQIFSYSEETAEQEAFQERLKELLPRLIRLLMGEDVMSFHNYMDFISWNQNIEAAYQAMQEEYKSEQAEENDE